MDTPRLDRKAPFKTGLRLFTPSFFHAFTVGFLLYPVEFFTKNDDYNLGFAMFELGMLKSFKRPRPESDDEEGHEVYFKRQRIKTAKRKKTMDG